MNAIAALLIASCNQYFTVQCQCEPLWTYEGYSIYRVERCGPKVEYFILDRTLFDGTEPCNEALLKNPTCQKLNKNSETSQENL